MWEPSDSARLREYHQRTGGKLREYLVSRIPEIKGTTIEAVALEAKFKEGHERMLKEFEALLEVPQLSDDSASANYTSM